MEIVSTNMEFDILEAFQKTGAYKTVTRGRDVYPIFREGYLAHALRKTEATCAEDTKKTPTIEGAQLPGLGFR